MEARSFPPGPSKAERRVAFELDELIHHYKRATQKLWSFCRGAGSQVYSTRKTLEWLREEGELPDWWERGNPRRTRD